MPRSLCPVAVLLTALAAFVAPGALAAPATTVQCGDVLTQSTTLDGDVVCPGETQDLLTGVAIGADGITLDLNGFSIPGPNRGEQVDGLQAGIVTNGAAASTARGSTCRARLTA